MMMFCRAFFCGIFLVLTFLFFNADPVLAMRCDCVISGGNLPANGIECGVDCGACSPLYTSCRPSALQDVAIPSVSTTSNTTQTVNGPATLQPPKINITFGGALDTVLKPVTCTRGTYCLIDWLPQYINVLYRYGIGIAAILATVMVMVGGFFWLMSGGSPDRISLGKEFITAAISGLVIALFSYTILNFINPNLVNLKPLQVYIPNAVEAQARIRSAATQEAQALGAGCPSAQEQQNGFQAVATSYSKPQRSNFETDQQFFCAVGLNCWCPNNNSRVDANCPGGYTACASFDYASTPYCTGTNSGVTPQEGYIAADPCFPIGTQICIDGHDYVVQDRGSAIKGRRFDIWNNEYDKAIDYGKRTVSARVGPCSARGVERFQ